MSGWGEYSWLATTIEVLAHVGTLTLVVLAYCSYRGNANVQVSAEKEERARKWQRVVVLELLSEKYRDGIALDALDKKVRVGVSFQDLLAGYRDKALSREGSEWLPEQLRSDVLRLILMELTRDHLVQQLPNDEFRLKVQSMSVLASAELTARMTLEGEKLRPFLYEILMQRNATSIEFSELRNALQSKTNLDAPLVHVILLHMCTLGIISRNESNMVSLPGATKSEVKNVR